MSVLVDGTNNQTFKEEGVMLSSDGLLVDLAEPRAIVIRGYNPLTREMKHYMLRVTKGGKLHLV